MINMLSAGFGFVLIAIGLVIVWIVRHRTAVAASVTPVHFPDRELLPVLRAADLFAVTGTEGLLTIIQSKCGFSAEHFDRTVMPVLKAHAEFVQQLPGAGSDHVAQPGGLLIHALEMADLALTFRRGQILPKGAAPEDIMRLEHRWTYAVLVAALTHDIGKHLSGLRVTMYREGSRVGEQWAPLSGTIADHGAARYSVRSIGEGEDQCGHLRDGTLPLFLYQRLVPAEALWWLSNDHEVTTELMAVLAGEKDRVSGAISELVLRADAESSQRHASSGPHLLLHRPRPDAATPGTADRRMATQSATHVPEVRKDEFLGDVAAGDKDYATSCGSDPVVPVAPTPQLSPQVVLPTANPSQSAAAANLAAPSAAALTFMAWLKAGLAQGTLSFNEIGAMVHFVKEGMLLVSPKIFQQFVRLVGEEAIGPGATVAFDKKQQEKDIQKQLLAANWHLRCDKGRSILKYQVLHGGKPAASVFGVVIAQPERFVNPIPPANPHLTRVASAGEG